MADKEKLHDRRHKRTSQTSTRTTTTHLKSIESDSQFVM